MSRGTKFWDRAYLIGPMTGSHIELSPYDINRDIPWLIRKLSPGSNGQILKQTKLGSHAHLLRGLKHDVLYKYQCNISSLMTA